MFRIESFKNSDKKADIFIGMRFCFLFVFGFCILSCQKPFIQDWANSFKEQSLTHLASIVGEYSLAPEDKADLLNLFFDLQRSEDCYEIQRELENHNILVLFEKEYRFRKGFAFDIFLDYDYEKSILNMNRSQEENVIFTVVSIWKTYFSLEEIQTVILKIRKCYPYY